MKKTVGFFSFVLSIQLLCAQTKSDSLLVPATLQECIQYAIEHQPSVKRAQLQEQIAGYTVRSHLADWLPQVGGVYTVQHNFQRGTNVFNGVATPVGVQNTSLGQFYLD